MTTCLDSRKAIKDKISRSKFIVKIIFGITSPPSIRSEKEGHRCTSQELSYLLVQFEWNLFHFIFKRFDTKIATWKQILIKNGITKKCPNLLPVCNFYAKKRTLSKFQNKSGYLPHLSSSSSQTFPVNSLAWGTVSNVIFIQRRPI